VPVLENQRHELFAQELAKGKSATEAYVLAGYRPSRKNASRLRANEGINARVGELQGAAARSAEITIESICAELDQANQIAMANGQASAMVSASTLRAKLAGLLKDRVEITAVNEFEHCRTVDEVVEVIVADAMKESPHAEFTAADKAKIAKMFTAINEYVESCKAKPVNSSIPADIERKRLFGDR
jgi:phage terminase small subunit